MRLFRLLVPALVVGLLASISLSAPASAQQTITVQIGPGRDAAENTGTATLTDLGGGRTRVDINVTTTNANQPAHLHADPCPGVAAVIFPLQNVMNGRSTTEVNASLADILARTKSVNLHRSPEQVPIYTGCGNLPTTAAAPAPAAAPAAAPAVAPAPAPAAAAAAAQPARPPAQLPRTGDLGFVIPLLT